MISDSHVGRRHSDCYPMVVDISAQVGELDEMTDVTMSHEE